jgi:hypothetical protein
VFLGTTKNDFHAIFGQQMTNKVGWCEFHGENIRLGD